MTREHVALVFLDGWPWRRTANRESFLLPIDTPAAIEVDDKGELRGDAANRAMISMASVLAPLEASKIGIVFLDACRNSASETGLGMTARMVSLGQARSMPILRGTGSLEVKPSSALGRRVPRLLHAARTTSLQMVPVATAPSRRRCSNTSARRRSASRT